MSAHHCTTDHEFTDEEARLLRRDPTGTAPIRRQFDKEVQARFKSLRAITQRVLVEMDVLGLRGLTPDNMQFAATYGERANVLAVVSDSLPEKGRAFNAWLRDAIAQMIIPNDWSAAFVQRAYAKGADDARKRLSLIERPLEEKVPLAGRAIHAHTYELIRARTQNSLKNVTDVMFSQMTQLLAKDLTEQRPPEYIARDLLGRIDAIGVNRARLVASCETISPYNEAGLNMYDEAGIIKVGVIPEVIAGKGLAFTDAKKGGDDKAPKPDYGPGIYKRGPKKGEPKATESWPRGRWPLVGWATAGDDYVCPECEALEDQVFTLQTARGMLPLHPNCRCALYPLEEDEDEDAE